MEQQGTAQTQKSFFKAFQAFFANARLYKALKTVFLIQGYSTVFKGFQGMYEACN